MLWTNSFATRLQGDNVIWATEPEGYVGYW